ncbi:phosphoadenosine phosphosulfate reductase family protein [Thioalkalivibrio sp. ALgr3]|uniref:phosphoadenosine phosphosulfate reductase domain-containing protein n=1 Tax=Thioalkalivibrio sp. ALgr3 TaxID=1239292 RepID=UPI00037D7DF1|nr:phosphoadenosine phosphosulfate reductase family protein [Thioalkalivibrio sp. ALgr3]
MAEFPISADRRVTTIVSISGGKDSTALRLLAIERGVEHVAVFADTGHEHPDTYEYVDYLEEATGPIVRVRADFTEQIQRKREFVQEKWPEHGVTAEKIERALAVLHPTGNPFLDLCIWKGRFPSTKTRFCSQELKHAPIFEQVVDPALEAGEVVSWQGVRAGESLARRDLLPVEEVGGGLWNYRPILDWSADDVFAQHRRHGVKWNPLYEQGMGRVGCMPCIHARKDELAQIATRFPEVIEGLREWERIVSEASKRDSATFFPVPNNRDGFGDEARHYSTHGIDQRVEWAMTGKGGRQNDWVREAEIDAGKGMCSSIYGLCEQEVA